MVEHIYRVRGIYRPEQATLATLTSNEAFSVYLDNDKRLKFKTIRHLGNDAAHNSRKILSERDAERAVTDLYHLMVWGVYNHSANPALAPMGRAFDRQLIPTLRRQAEQRALTQQRMAEAEAERTAEMERIAAEHQARVDAMDAELERLRAQLAEAQAAKTLPDTHDYKEAETRDYFIDLLLGEAGWPLAHKRDREYPVTGLPTPSGSGRVDYVLWGRDGRPLGVVEAKRTRESVDIGRDQAKAYADALQAATGVRPVIFYTNGYTHYLWDDAAGYPPREVQGFLTEDELALMIERRTSRQQLSGQQVNTEIAGRGYQLRAVASVAESFDARRRKALLVMATGSGKTRTTIALVDLLSRAGWVKRVLFLADRTALVNQAVKASKAHLPNLATVNLVEDRQANGRVFASTYPTMLNIINRTRAEGEATLREFGPGYFDLIVVDEAHRSVYAKYKAIFDYFDALLVGLTATPKDEVDFNTYALFDMEAGVPTDAYTLDQAVSDGYLVPTRGFSVGTRFLREGIRYDQLSEAEQEQWESADWGDAVPEEITSEALNRFLFNADTVDKVLTTLMEHGYRVADGELLGKTIIFAKNQAHADFIYERFNALFPGYGGSYAQVITNRTYVAESAIEKFSQPESLPRIAISVDMLDTGIDVPEILNLVFFKLVRAKTGDSAALARTKEVAQTLAENLLLTKAAVPAIAAVLPYLEQLAADDWWVDVSPALLEFMRKKLRGVTHLLDKGQKKIVYTNFQDELIEPVEVEVVRTQVGMNQERFEQKMQEYLREHLDAVAVQKVLRGKQLTDEDFAALADLIDASGIGGPANVQVARESGGLGVFVRSLVGLSRDEARAAFAVFLDESRYSATQIRFVQRIVDELSENGTVDPSRLYEDPYVSLGDPLEMLGDDDAFEIVSILNRIRATAEVA
ncbi:type I restriction endonuclease subunit R [Rothia sp. 88186D007BW]